MGIVNELQAAAESDDVLTLLMKAKRVASKLLRHDITAWLDHEQNGYKQYPDLPDYRRIPAEFAYDTNGYIPAGYGLVRKGITRMGKMGVNQKIPFPDSIGAIVEMLRKIDENDGGLYYPCDTRTSDIIKSGMSGMSEIIDQIVILWSLHLPTVRDIPNQVRNKVMDWALELERADIHGEGHSFTAQEKKLAEQVTFYIDHLQGGILMNSPGATQNVTINEVGNAIQNISHAVEASDELDAVDKADIKAALNVIRDLAAAEPTPKTKLKLTEKLAVVTAGIGICEKLWPVAKPWVELMKKKLGIP